MTGTGALVLLALAVVGAALLKWGPTNLKTTTKETSQPMINRSALMQAAARAAKGAPNAVTVPMPKRGAEIFSNSDSPQTWDDYIGQSRAKMALRVAIKSSLMRGKRLPHVLIASGSPGVGKSALARLIGAEMGVGVTEITGEMSQSRAAAVVGVMKGGDILLWDEFHQALNSGKKHAEWLLTFMQDGTLMTEEGLKPMPKVTLVAATTEKGDIPDTIMSRFGVTPVLEAYTEDEYLTITRNAAEAFFDWPLSEKTLRDVAAASASPRIMKHVLGNLRDAELAGLIERVGGYDLPLKPVLDLMGLTWDGLDADTVDYMLKLYELGGGPVGITTLCSGLDLNERPKQTEGALIQRGFLIVAREGRTLTTSGKARVKEYLIEQGVLDNVDEAV